jgi:hypothetical protein
VPLVEWAGGYDVGVAGKAEQRAGAATACPQIGDRTAIDVFAGKTDAFEALGDDRHATAIFRCDRTAGNQLLG